MSTVTDRILVEVESELEPIVPEFLDNRKMDCTRIETLLAAESFGEIRTLSHRMKGSGGSYGFDEISLLGEAMEEAAVAEDRETILQAIRQLAAYLDKVDVIYV
jgi:HPt (histidine-containing phosphotransfer) domain-containing protein